MSYRHPRHHPETDLETAITSILMICGFCLQAFIVGTLTAQIESM
jgi:hypothetical protein